MPPSEDHPEEDSITSVNDNLTKLNPYNTYIRDWIIKQATEIKFVKDRYTTPMIVELSCPLKSGSNIINIASIHCKIFAATRLLDSSPKTTAQDGRIIEHPKDFPTGNDYIFVSKHNRRTWPIQIQEMFHKTQDRIRPKTQSIQRWRRKHHGYSTRLLGVDQMRQIWHTPRGIHWIAQKLNKSHYYIFNVNVRYIKYVISTITLKLKHTL